MNRSAHHENKRPREPTMSDPLAYFLTWTTYGTWLPGDERGWVKLHKGFQPPSARIKTASESLLKEPACHLDAKQREIVEQTIRDHCCIRGWHLHAVRCLSNHVHVVVTAADRDPKTVRNQLKSWCTRKLKELQRARHVPPREHWWSERGSTRHIDDEDSLEAAIVYVLEGQE